MAERFTFQKGSSLVIERDGKPYCSVKVDNPWNCLDDDADAAARDLCASLNAKASGATMVPMTPERIAILERAERAFAASATHQEQYGLTGTEAHVDAASLRDMLAEARGEVSRG